jgi:seryl-tRNA synthetase
MNWKDGQDAEVLRPLKLPTESWSFAPATGLQAAKTYDLEFGCRAGDLSKLVPAQLRRLQARRARVRYRKENGKPILCIRSTAPGWPLDGHQWLFWKTIRRDGSVVIPEVLRACGRGRTDCVAQLNERATDLKRAR